MEIGKTLFVEILDNLEEQMTKDKLNGELISEAFGGDKGLCIMYDNSLLIRTLVKVLKECFPTDEDGYSDIEHHIFDTNFGKCIKGGYTKTAEEFYDELITKKNVISKPNIFD